MTSRVDAALARAVAGLVVDALEPVMAPQHDGPIREKAVAIVADEFLARAAAPSVADPAKRRNKKRRSGYVPRAAATGEGRERERGWSDWQEGRERERRRERDDRRDEGGRGPERDWNRRQEGGERDRTDRRTQREQEGAAPPERRSAVYEDAIKIEPEPGWREVKEREERRRRRKGSEPGRYEDMAMPSAYMVMDQPREVWDGSMTSQDAYEFQESQSDVTDGGPDDDSLSFPAPIPGPTIRLEPLASWEGGHDNDSDGANAGIRDTVIDWGSRDTVIDTDGGGIFSLAERKGWAVPSALPPLPTVANNFGRMSLDDRPVIEPERNPRRAGMLRPGLSGADSAPSPPQSLQPQPQSQPQLQPQAQSPPTPSSRAQHAKFEQARLAIPQEAIVHEVTSPSATVASIAVGAGMMSPPVRSPNNNNNSSSISSISSNNNNNTTNVVRDAPSPPAPPLKPMHSGRVLTDLLQSVLDECESYIGTLGADDEGGEEEGGGGGGGSTA
ncbi:hypothetical protein HK104_006401 [Borealophlyctis nickersoniae]|nr:hypothetical protein HK104_006401 [Borealophlyctis nickersoniae]